ncbi:CD44 molecule (Indian blood group) [Homo sapiens]|uniref:Isoform 11 of CD44 antigen n=1 Tax=Homo sapiens TaxID=9606 RepID=P16070-11|nr:CD44 antigen isoform 6 precursor [Homo sapiens]ABQ59315.1 CD44 variant [Homo sapiens]KAI2559392.1 CD44 molecule (Indian blood group) [Homo sapiens]KAI4070742.1 CD44 molecule (Indian blood group) [Homo sapiens]|eukprot:NP_001189484.1 CD44 antigen isoform 6 precursor [Homo sapiens]
MDKFWWHAAWGLCLVPLSLAQIDLNITCRFAGVFHVEKNGRYSISRTEAADLCKAFNSTLPTMAQMEKALSIGFETCRYGFIEGHVVIPRIHPNSICAANNTGVYILTSNTSQYDTYCFNASAPPEEDCTSVTDLPNAFDGPITITIVNRDGTRYVQKGEYRTNPEDIYPSNPTDDDVSSGSSSERSSTSGGYIFYTFSTVHPIPDEDSPWITDSTDRIPATNRNDVTGGRRDPNHSEGSTTLLEGYTSHYPHTKESRTFIPVTSAKTGSFGVTAVTVGDSNSNVNRSLSGDQDTFHPSGGSHTTHGSESDGHSHGSQEGGANTTSGPIRTPQIPEWLIILASLLALALILAVCIAVNSRRRCGQKKKLVINSGNGAVEDRKPSGLNGEASKSQEMVHLVNKESSETPDQFMTADETRNLQNVDMKIGV